MAKKIFNIASIVTLFFCLCYLDTVNYTSWIAKLFVALTCIVWRLTGFIERTSDKE